MPELLESLLDFIKMGGAVMVGIVFLTLLLWSLLLERLYYMRFIYPGEEQRWTQICRDHSNRKCPFHSQVRMAVLSAARNHLEGSLFMIKTLITICPLLGLLGTVVGMIEVFDVLALMGTANARMIASGISKATLPTMAGMGISLTGMLVGSRYERAVRKKVTKLMLNISEG